MKIKDWSNDERPRERVMALGPEAVSNAELLAILIGSGTPEVTSVDLMRKVLSEHGDSLRALGTLSRQELEKYNGIGPAKAVAVQAAMELGKRLLLETKGPKAKFTSSADAHDYFRVKMSDMPHEECHLLLLNVKNQFMGHHVVSRGGISESSVDVRLVLRHALIAGATNLILAHNHPSGNPMPSRQDDDLTMRLQKACQTMGLRLLDHIIIGDDSYYSYADEGRVNG
ncbi:MAG: DNA repair protein RadC [Bacteroidaceae bacterium]|nr:DNA repair protein RadC [Bacteroidaceae bacterium]